MDWKRIGRTLVCMLVVVCLILNISPIRAKAFVLETTAGTMGLIALLILATCGVVFNPQSAAQVEAIGNSLTTHLYQWGTEAEQLDAVESWIDNATVIDGTGGVERPDWLFLTVPLAIAGGVIEWITSIIQGQAIGVPDTAAQDFRNYNGVLLPEFTAEEYAYYEKYLSDCPYSYIWDLGDGNYRMIFSPCPVYAVDSNVVFDSSKVVTYYYFDLMYSSISDTYFWSSMQDNASFVNGKYMAPIWSNFDILDNAGGIFLYGSEPAQVTTEFWADLLVGDIPSGVLDGTITQEDITIPDIDYGSLISSGQTSQDAILGTMQQLANGTMTYDQYMESIKVDTSTVPDIGTDSGTLGQIEAGTFWDTLVKIITVPFEWLANTILEGIKAIFVPSEDFLTAKVDAIHSQFGFADSIMSTVDFFGAGLKDIQTKPPVIYVDLGATTGDYDLGGKVVFVDLSWYEEYKPVGDALISAFLWAVLAWRLFLKLPSIIGGMPGDFVMGSMQTVGADRLLPFRKKEYENVRRLNRKV